MSGNDTIYSALGGATTIDAAIDLFYVRVIDDPNLKRFFSDMRLDRLKDHQKAFLTMALGGESSYHGPGLKRVHDNLGVTNRHFDDLIGHLAVAFSELGVGDELIDGVISKVAGLRGDIVARHTVAPPVNQ